MRITTQPERFIDNDDGEPITEVYPEGSRFDAMSVKQTDEGIEIRAHDQTSDEVIEVQAELTEELYRGVEVENTRRRDVTEDIQDLCQIVGYTLIDPAVESYE